MIFAMLLANYLSSRDIGTPRVTRTVGIGTFDWDPSRVASKSAPKRFISVKRIKG
jgi:hypothetical protein